MKTVYKFAGQLISLDRIKLFLLFALTMLSLNFVSCKKHRYKACLTVNKSNVAVDETVTFTNCSDFDGGYTDSHWTFGDGKDVYTKGQASVTHSFSSAGQFEIRLTIGEKENSSEQTKTITVQ
ncbi:MAG: PKD domain-containing protein [Bacteroidetes bacterium]|nr:PKD domain-containing protein [Bacteroidota bacterium]